MSSRQYAHGLFAGFATLENPFQSPNGMEENLRVIDDHIGVSTLQAPQAPGDLPVDPSSGDGQIFSDGTYGVYNATAWHIYAPMTGIIAAGAGGALWRNTGEGWERAVSFAQMDFIQAGTAAVTRPGLDKLRELITPQDFGATINVGLDTAAAFQHALALGRRVSVPRGAYTLSQNPLASYGGSFYLDIDLGTTFDGAGASDVGGFATMYTNPYNVAAGPYFLGRDLPEPPGEVNTPNLWSLEIISPRTGAYSQLGMYVGGDSNHNVTGDNVQCLINTVQNIHDADLMPDVYGPGSVIYKSIEIDVNVDVSAPGARARPGTMGMLFTGGGAGGQYQGNVTYGILFQRSTCLWETAIDISASVVALAVTASDTPLMIRTEYHAPSGASIPSGTTGRGIYFDNAPYYAGPLFIGRQLRNDTDAFWVARKTDSGASGNFINFRDAADQNTLFKVGIDGSITSYAPSNANGSTVAAGGAEFNGLTLRGTTNLRLGVDFTPGDSSTNGTIVLIDASNRRIALAGRIIG